METHPQCNQNTFPFDHMCHPPTYMGYPAVGGLKVTVEKM